MALPVAHVALPESSPHLPLPKSSKGAPPPRTPGPHMVNFYALDGSVDLTVMMGNGPAQLTGGIGGWVSESRRGLAPVLWWDSPPSYRQTIPVLFTGSGDALEQRISDLYTLGRSSGSRKPPPLIVIAGPAVHRADLQWVVENIEAGSRVERREADGNRTRQDFTVTLLAYDGVDVLVERSPSRKAATEGGEKPSSGRKTYRVAKGDTLPKIAARKDIYNDGSKWKRIANANGIRDPRTLKVGQVLKIPR